MSLKKKETIIKILIVALGICEAACFIIPIVGRIMYDAQVDKIEPGQPLQEPYNSFLIGSMIASGVIFLVYMILLWVFSNTSNREEKKADIKTLKLNGYEDLMTHIQHSVEAAQYLQYEVINFCEGGTVTFWLKQSGFDGLRCVVVVRTSIMTDEILDCSENIVDNLIKQYYHDEQPTNLVNMIAIICVDRVSPVFRNVVNSPVQQEFKRGRFVAGISFGSNSVYIAKRANDFAVTRYKRLRKEFFDIIGAENIV